MRTISRFCIACLLLLIHLHVDARSQPLHSDKTRQVWEHRGFVKSIKEFYSKEFWNELKANGEEGWSFAYLNFAEEAGWVRVRLKRPVGGQLLGWEFAQFEAELAGGNASQLRRTLGWEVCGRNFSERGAQVVEQRPVKKPDGGWPVWLMGVFNVSLREFNSERFQSRLRAHGQGGWTVSYVSNDTAQRWVRLGFKRPARVPIEVWEFTQFVLSDENDPELREKIAEGWQLCGEIMGEKGTRFLAQRPRIEPDF